MLPLSLIDFATVYDGETPHDSFKRSVEMARKAEDLGFSRIWYAEHHNMPHISSAAPAVLISHIASQTESIRLGSGGVMLPNHSPLVIAEQFGTLAELYPDRIDLGLGRAPGTDMKTIQALRRDPQDAERFPSDVVELQGYLEGKSRIEGVQAIPGRNTNVPLYILGSSLFGAQLAAQLGLPYSFASHFAPAALEQATTTYRQNFQPSEHLSEPYVIAAVNVTAADTSEEAAEQTRQVQRKRVESMVGRGRQLTESELDMLVHSPAGQQIIEMLRFTAQGTGDEVKDYLDRFANVAQADELMISLQSPSTAESSRSMEILADAWGLADAR
ncbi:MULTISPECIES: LLM class flavin-dependent oxidoreductase [Micrococcaceae]|uniref:LLM class flavin-dependent oxidoreductase n=1 Tax=unclassified Kocuria TaxID=2649579 RepID=UPI001012742C|nr:MULTISPECIES: LLM class flavin-dependent oxidoreductase [unclassified Kocuria]